MATLFACLSYRAAAAIGWMQALGFEVTTRQDGDEGSDHPAELKRGDAAVMVASADADYQVPPLRGRSTGAGLYLLTGEVAAQHDAAVEAGGTTVFSPERTEWGTGRARAPRSRGLRVELRLLRVGPAVVTAVAPLVIPPVASRWAAVERQLPRPD
jgi:uncharacterized glyoxalase superfamily protein PhnB